MNNICIGNNIRNWRSIKRMKQGTLAEIIQITGAAVSNIENGKTDITITRLRDIADALELEPTQLLKDPFEDI